MSINGNLNKMKAICPENGGMVNYSLTVNGQDILNLNELLGQEIEISHDGKINCVHCGAKTKKSFGQGSCYICFTKLACNDMCIMKPETCHYEEGTCREPKWGSSYCLSPQTLYLARSGSIKIGITRAQNHLVRWADQGASEGMIIGEFANRLDVGKAEKAISDAGISDRTSWHKMLKNDITDQPFEEIIESIKEILSPVQLKCLIDAPKVVKLDYPNLGWPTKVKSLRLDKVSSFKSKLKAIKGQYLVFEDHVINIRSHAGYNVNIKVHG